MRTRKCSNARLFNLRLDKIFVMAAVIFTLVACDSKPLPVDATVKTRPAKLFTIGTTNESSFLRYPAVIRSQQLSILSFDVSGTLNRVHVVEAQLVNKGDVLAELDQRDLQTKLLSARAQFDNADTEYLRAARLIKEDAISQSDFDQRKSQRDVSKSQLDTAEKALEDAVIFAPFDGAVAKVSVKKRQLVQAGEGAITILGAKGLEATVNMPASILANAGGRRSVPSNTYIVLDAASDFRIPAVFKEASLEADNASQTYQVSFAFQAPEKLVVLPGMNAVVWIEKESDSNADSEIRIPLSAIEVEGNNSYAWVVDKESMTVSRKTIVVEDGIGENLSILNGLKKGETIVATGTSYLSEGMKIRPWVQ
ncbi:MAG: RND family efflux transporter MFP subunit [Oceanicoccus sp.]|jgi:RND family efflux transporter MFP subunit